MKKLALTLSCLLGSAFLCGCDDYNDSSKETMKSPDICSLIYFNGSYVQTNDTDWPIAFDSYQIENNNLLIYGRFITVPYYANNGLDYIENLLNTVSLPSLHSYTTEPTVILANEENTFWRLLSIDENFVANFVLIIDVSPIFEECQELGVLDLGTHFDIIHYFKGCYSGIYYDYTQGLNQ